MEEGRADDGESEVEVEIGFVPVLVEEVAEDGVDCEEGQQVEAEEGGAGDDQLEADGVRHQLWE